MLKKSVYTLLILLLLQLVGYAQVSVSFSPAIYGQTVEGLAFAQINSTLASDIRVALSVEVKQNQQRVARLTTAAFNVRPGMNVIDRAAFSAGRFSFGTTYAGSIARESGRFPEGEYEYCYELEVVEAKGMTLPPFFEQCFAHQLQPLTPLLLIIPVDEDESCNKRPNFSWQPPVPLSVDARFRLVLVELKEGQDVAEAVAYNQPLINQANIITNNLNYPVYLPELKEGASYAWQVTVYTDKTILKKSEIWRFTIKCNERQAPVITDSYRELKDGEDGNYYVTEQMLKFSFTNPYKASPLHYAIVCTSDPKVTVKNLPQLWAQPGLNKYEIDLSENNTLKEGKEYLLRIFLPNNRPLQLRFMYKKKGL